MGALNACKLWKTWRLLLVGDVYIEAIKPYFNESQEFESARGASRDTLWVCLDTGLRLLHPFMPYITEELQQHLPQPKEAYVLLLCFAEAWRLLPPCTFTSLILQHLHLYHLFRSWPKMTQLLFIAPHIINKDQSVFLQLRGALDTKDKMSMRS